METTGPEPRDTDSQSSAETSFYIITFIIDWLLPTRFSSE